MILFTTLYCCTSTEHRSIEPMILRNAATSEHRSVEPGPLLAFAFSLARLAGPMSPGLVHRVLGAFHREDQIPLHLL